MIADLLFLLFNLIELPYFSFESLTFTENKMIEMSREKYWLLDAFKLILSWYI